MDKKQLQNIANHLLQNGKGILAIDESHATCTKRFEALGVESSEENRRQYRQLLVTAPEIEKYISGMILFDETLRQNTDTGETMAIALEEKGIFPGIKVDTGAKDLANHPNEKITEGLDNLRERLQEYKTLGTKFAKWRAVITIGENIPSYNCITSNTHALARYAALCQEAGIVPIVEPEVLIDGEHTIEKCYEVASKTLNQLFQELKKQNVFLPGLILKASMVLPGKNCQTKASKELIAKKTVDCFLNNVPATVAGIVFLSGGQTNIESSTRLNEMNKTYKSTMPWPLSFSYGRAIQNPALETWAKEKNIELAQEKLLERAKLNSLASKGKYDENMEKQL